MLNSQEGCISLPLWKRYSKGRTWKWSRNKSSSLASQVPMSKISISAPHMSTNIYGLFFVLKDKKKSWHCQHSLLRALLITGEIQRVYLKAVCFVLSYIRHVDHDLICSKFCKSKQTNKQTSPERNAIESIHQIVCIIFFDYFTVYFSFQIELAPTAWCFAFILLFILKFFYIFLLTTFLDS